MIDTGSQPNNKLFTECSSKIFEDLHCNSVEVDLDDENSQMEMVATNISSPICVITKAWVDNLSVFPSLLFQV